MDNKENCNNVLDKLPVAIIVTFAALTRLACADDRIQIASQIANAMSAVRSVAIVTHKPWDTRTTTIQIDPNPRVRETHAFLKSASDSILDADASYIRSSDVGWKKGAPVARLSVVLEALRHFDASGLNVSSDASLTDAALGRVLVPSTAIEQISGADPAVFTCLYSRVTFLLQSCEKTLLGETIVFNYKLSEDAFDLSLPVQGIPLSK